MSTKIRVFISSTMEDLGNERRAVIAALGRLNLEPVNAENLYPTGGTSWEVIADEIDSSHLFILLLGERYGWIPQTGYGAGLGKSVTHLEADHARGQGIRILPFFKRLSYGATADTDDAKARDFFRREVGDWATGGFRAEFEWADDLGRKVGDTLLDLFQNSHLKSEARERDRSRRQVPLAAAPTGDASEAIPFIEAAARGGAVLVAGAGISVAAGLPTANVMAGVLAQRLGLASSGDEVLARHRFADLAALAQARLGRDGLHAIIAELLNTAQRVSPTPAHDAAVAAFPTIVTSNFDTLFEQAAKARGLRYAVRTSAVDPPASDAEVTICKIDGTITDPTTLILTDEDSERAYGLGSLWSDIAALLETSPVAVVGHSLRDDRMRRLLSRRRRDLPGVYVSPVVDPLDAILLERFALRAVRASADSFMTALAQAPRR